MGLDQGKSWKSEMIPVKNYWMGPEAEGAERSQPSHQEAHLSGTAVEATTPKDLLVL